MTIGNAAADQEEGTETQITTDTSSQSDSDIYGEQIVWQDSRNGNWDIYMYDLSSSTETQITTNESNQSSSAIYGERIVWQDDRNGNWDIYMYDLSTSTEIQITTSESNQSGPAIYGDRIVWTDDRNGISDIYMYDISTSQETQISTSGSASSPEIYNDRIVWQEYIDLDGFYGLMLYDLSTQQETKIAETGLRLAPELYGFAIHGNKIVYSYFTSDDLPASMFVYDISTQQSIWIADGYTPDIHGDRIVWEESLTEYYPDEFRYYSYNNISMYDLSTQQKIQITTSGKVSDPVIYEDRMVWQDERNGNLDIYMFTLASDEVPEPPVANFSANITSGYAPLTVSFTDLSKNATEWNWDFSGGATSIEQNPIYTYSVAGTYTVNLTVSNSNGTDSKIATITVSEKTVSDDNDTDEGDGTGNDTMGKETQITTNNSSQSSPYIYEDRIVWTDWRNDNGSYTNSDIYMYDLSTANETRISTSGSAYSPVIYGDRIVWQDSRNGKSDIYMFNVSTSTESRITTSGSVDYGSFIYGDRIVWMDNRNSESVVDDFFGGFDVYMYDLSTKKETRITKSTIPANPDLHVCVDIYDNKIVWGPDMDGSNISVYDLSTSRQENVSSALQLYNIAFSGNRIVGTNNREGREGVINMYDLSTVTETKITADFSAYGGPDISGNRIVWPDHRNSNYPSDSGSELDLYMYDLSTSTEAQITTSKSVAWSAPSIYGDRIVWEDNRNGNSDIYMFTLASDEVPPLDDNDTDEGNETDDDTQVPDNDSDNGDDTETDNETEVPDNDSDNGTDNETEVPDNGSDNGAGNETDDGAQVPDNESDTGTGDETDNETEVPDNCSSELTPLDSTQALKEYVECTYKCHEKTKTGLASLLDKSMCFYKNSEDEKAISMLKSFIHLAERMKGCKQISADEADYMVRGAKKIIDQIEAN